MKFVKKDLVYFIALCLIILYFNSNTEKMTNTDIKKNTRSI